jgi:hypothetical protein
VRATLNRIVEVAGRYPQSADTVSAVNGIRTSAAWLAKHLNDQKTPLPYAMGRYLGFEFVTNLIQALLLLLVLAATHTGGILRRAGLAALIGLLSWVAIDASYWNWYSFPNSLALLGFSDQVAGSFLAGLAIAWCIRKWQRPAAAAASA